MKPRDRETPADSRQRSSPTRLGAAPDTRRFIEEVTRLAIESVENGWGGPFGAVIDKEGAVVGRGQNRVLLTGCPVYHAEIIGTAEPPLRADGLAVAPRTGSSCQERS